ncbi:MAG: PepSY domain-containing protein [Rhodocyclales bacterium]|nr:PepSY domain-containing protein [Rhodocyclales bacterium]
MRTSSLIASITLATTLLTGGALIAAPVLAQATNTSASATSAVELSVKQIVERVEAAGYRDIKEVEREDDRYEVKATSADGRRAELYLDPVSGEINKTKFKDAKRDD